MDQSKFMSLNKQDLVHVLVFFAVSVVFAAFSEFVEVFKAAGSFKLTSADWYQVVRAGLEAASAFLTFRFFTDHENKFGKAL